MAPARWNSACALLVVGIVTFHALTIRPGHDWGGDFSMYIAHARNIAEGTSYAETGYIHDPASIAAPAAYPPLFPLLLAPIYASFGLDLHAMKLSIVVMFGLSLWVLFLTFRPYLEPAYAVALIGLIGLSPFFWDFKDSVLADVPALLFIYTAIFATERADRAHYSSRTQAAFGLLIGFLIYLAYGTRSVGAIVLAALIAHQIIRHRRITRICVVATVTMVTLAVLQNVLVPIESGYSRLFSLSPETLVNNAIAYGKALSLLWENGSSKFLRGLLFTAGGILAIWGYWTRFQRGPSVLELFPVFYAVPILAFSVGGLTQPRYVIPLIPLYFFYAACGVSALHALFGSKWIPALLLAVAVTCYGVRYSSLDYGQIPTGIEKPEARALFEFVRENTRPDDVLLFAKPRVMALYGQRRVVSYHGKQSYDALWHYILTQGVSYVIVGNGGVELELDYLNPTYLTGFVDQFSERFQLVFTNAHFHVYEVLQQSSVRVCTGYESITARACFTEAQARRWSKSKYATNREFRLTDQA